MEGLTSVRKIRNLSITLLNSTQWKSDLKIITAVKSRNNLIANPLEYTANYNNRKRVKERMITSLAKN